MIDKFQKFIVGIEDDDSQVPKKGFKIFSTQLLGIYQIFEKITNNLINLKLT
jgi:hypothetical protein